MTWDTADFNCPNCEALNDINSVECPECGMIFADINLEIYESEHFYYDGEDEDYIADLADMGYDDSSRTIRTIQYRIPILIIIVIVVLFALKILDFSLNSVIIVGILIAIMLIQFPLLDRRIKWPPEKIFAGSDIKFCTNCRYRKELDQELCPYCFEKWGEVHKVILLPHLDLVFKENKIRVYPKVPRGQLHFVDIWDNGLSGFFREYEKDKIYELNFNSKKSRFSKKEKLWVSFSYYDPVFEIFWNYLTRKRMAPNLLRDYMKTREISREIWEYEISEKAMYEIKNYFEGS